MLGALMVAGISPASALATAVLNVADRNPLQRHGVMFNASGSQLTGVSADQLSYLFKFGDGITQSSFSPLALHAYAQPGHYVATVVVSGGGLAATSAPVTLAVREWLPPTVTIVSPRQDATVRLRSRAVSLRGAAVDPVGVRSVRLSLAFIGRASSARASAVSCYFFNGRRGLHRASCSAPEYFKAHVTGSRWSYKLSPGSQLPTGIYELRVQATDNAGNQTSAFRARLGNLIDFTLLR